MPLKFFAFGAAQPRLVLGLAAALLFSFGGNRTFAGSVFVSGHDADFHALSGNTAGAINIIDRGLDYVRNGNSAPILFIQTSTANLGLGDHLNSELGLQASGYAPGTTPGNHYVMVNAAGFASANLSSYSAIFVPSDHGGTLTGDDLEALNARSTDILNYINAGGGLLALAEDGNRTPATDGSTPAAFGFLPFLVTSSPLSEFENGNTLTPFGASLGLTGADINGNYSHNVFTSTGGMTPVDFDAGGEILTLATRQTLTPEGVPDLASSAWLFCLALSPALVWRRLQTRTHAQ